MNEAWLPDVIAEVGLRETSTRAVAGLDWAEDGRLAVATSEGACILTPERLGAELSLRQAWVKTAHDVRAATWSPTGVAWDGRAALCVVCAATGRAGVYVPPRAAHAYEWEKAVVLVLGGRAAASHKSSAAGAADWRDALDQGRGGTSNKKRDRCTVAAWCPVLLGPGGGPMIALGFGGGAVALRTLTAAELKLEPEDVVLKGHATATALAWCGRHYICVGDAAGGVHVWRTLGGVCKQWTCRQPDLRCITCIRAPRFADDADAPFKSSIAWIAAGKLERWTVADVGGDVEFARRAGDEAMTGVVDCAFDPNASADDDDALICCTEHGGPNLASRLASRAAGTHAKRTLPDADIFWSVGHTLRRRAHAREKEQRAPRP
mmetsp:Transcript_17076/g.60734  ORF Transcript_17076/g.60734 Transcript_17076/m.60734 type:complete len:378 (-) Transcript_17076:895-2028(-)